MDNHRIIKAVNQENEAKRDWFLADKFLRSKSPIIRELGTEMRNEQLQSWLKNRR